MVVTVYGDDERAPGYGWERDGDENGGKKWVPQPTAKVKFFLLKNFFSQLFFTF